MKKVSLIGDETTYIVEEEKVYRCLVGETIDSIWVKKEEFDKLNFKDVDTSDKDEVIEFLEENNLTDGTDFRDTHSSDTLVEPREDEYVVAYSLNSEFGEDPYMWDYTGYGYTYWDNSNQVEIFGNTTRGVKLLEENEIREKNRNYGRAETYRIYKDEDGDILLSYENEGYCTPEKCVNTKTEEFSDSSTTVTLYETSEDGHDEMFVFIELPNDYNAEFVSREEAMRIVKQEVNR